MNLLNKLQKNWNVNGILFFPIVYRRLLNKFYNFLFLKKYHIQSDYSSFIYGIKYMKIGSVTLGRHCRIEIITEYNNKKLNPCLKIGERVSINDRVHIGCANYIEIGDDCLFASNIYISDHNHGMYKGDKQSSIFEPVIERDLDYDKSIIIGKNVWIGEGVAVLPGAKIGDNSIIGSNAVVIGEIPANSITVGVPAKIIKQYDKNTKSWLRV